MFRFVPAALTAEEIREVNTRYHDLAAQEYDFKWGIDFGATGRGQVIAKLHKALGHPPARYARSLEIGAGTGYFTLNMLRAGDSFRPGAWNLGRKYKWMCPIAVGWTLLMIVVFSLPFVPAGVPWNKNFDWTALNYSPFVNAALFLAIGIAWFAGARRKYTGPVRTIEFDEALGIVDEAPAGPAPAPGS